MDQFNSYADAHTHIQDFENVDEVIEEAAKQNVRHIVCNSTTFDYLPPSLQNKYPFLIPCIGLHPWYIPNEEINYDVMETRLKLDPRVQVGEIGLDFLKAKEKDAQKRQCEIFQRQFELGMKHNRAISVHCVRASGEMLKIMKKCLKNSEQAAFDASIIMHSYGCPKEITQSLDKLYPNVYYSFSLSVANRLENIANVKRDRLLFETDAPYQHNEKVAHSARNESHPKYLRELIEIGANYLNEPNLKQIVFNNFLRAFRLIQLQK